MASYRRRSGLAPFLGLTVLLSWYVPPARAQPAPRVVDFGELIPQFTTRHQIMPGAIHRFHLPDGPNVFTTLLINQISADVTARVQPANGSAYAVDASN